MEQSGIFILVYQNGNLGETSAKQYKMDVLSSNWNLFLTCTVCEVALYYVLLFYIHIHAHYTIEFNVGVHIHNLYVYVCFVAYWL